MIRDKGEGNFVYFYIHCLEDEFFSFFFSVVHLTYNNELLVVIKNHTDEHRNKHLGYTILVVVKTFVEFQIIYLNIHFLELTTADCPNLQI